MKTKLVTWLIKLANLIDENLVKSCDFNKRIVVDLQKYIPPDNKFHSFNLSISGHMKFPTEEAIDEEVYVDGLLVSRKVNNDQT